MNLFILILMLIEAAISLCGLAYTAYCITAGISIAGVLIGLFTFAIFAIFAGGMWVQHFKKH